MGRSTNLVMLSTSDFTSPTSSSRLGCVGHEHGPRTFPCLRCPPLTNRLSWLKSPKECYEGRIKLAVDYVKQELGRLKAHYEERTADDRFYALASECIAEIYGSIRQGDFNSMSSLRGFMAGKQNIIHDLIQQQSGSVRLR